MKTTAKEKKRQASVSYRVYHAVIRQTFSSPRVVCLFHQLHGVWPATPFLRVPQQEALRPDVAVD